MCHLLPWSPWPTLQCDHSVPSFPLVFPSLVGDQVGRESSVLTALSLDSVLEFYAPLVRDAKLEIACVTVDQSVTANKAGVFLRG